MIRVHRHRPRTSPTAGALVAAVLLMIAVLAAPGAAHAQSTAERIVTGWAESLRAAGATVTWAGLAHSSGDDRLELRNVEIGATDGLGNSWKIAVPSAVFVALADRAEGGFTARAVTAAKATLETSGKDGKARIDVLDLDQRDVVVPRLTFPTIDPDHPFSTFWTATRVLDPLAASLASIGRMTLKAESTDAAVAFTGEIDGIALTGLAKGRAEKLRIGALRLTSTESGAPVKIEFGGAEIEQYEAVAWRRLFDDTEYAGGKGDGEWRRLAKSASFGPVSIDAGDTRLSIGATRAAARWVRQFDQPLGALFDRLLLQSEGLAESDVYRVVLALFRATRTDGWSMETIHLSGPELDHADIDRVRVGAFSGERLADFAVEGLDVVADKGVVRLGRFGLTDLRMPDGGDLDRAIAAAVVGADIDPSSLVPTVGHVEIAELEALEPGSPTVTLKGLTIDLGGFIRAIPTTVAIELRHFVAPAALSDEEGRRTLARLGYDRIDLSGALRLAWQKATRELTIGEAAVEIAEMGRLAVEARLTDVPESVFSRPETAALALLGVRLAEARATYTDASIANRLLKMMADDQGMKPARFKRKLLDEISPLFAEIRDGERRRRIVEAVKRFIEDPKMLAAVLRPRDPVPLTEILAATETPAALAERLELTVSAGR